MPSGDITTTINRAQLQVTNVKALCIASLAWLHEQERPGVPFVMLGIAHPAYCERVVSRVNLGREACWLKRVSHGNTVRSIQMQRSDVIK